jgi:glycine hydroxymethyltransferase
LADLISLAINKNTVPGDKSALVPSGVRIGSPAMTTRGCKEAHFIEIMKFI